MGLKCDSNAPATKGQLRQLAGFVELPLTQLGWTNAESDAVLGDAAATAEFRKVIQGWAEGRRSKASVSTRIMTFAADPRFSAETGEFETAAELVSALREPGLLAYLANYVRDTLLPGVVLCKENATVGGCRVTPRQVGNQRSPLCREFYDTQLPNHGLVRPVWEYGALLALKWARQLRDTGDCEFKVGEYVIVLSDPLYVDSYGRQYFLYVGRLAGGLSLDDSWFYPDDEIDLDSPWVSACK